MTLDFLTPGSYGDSYGSRLTNPNADQTGAGGYYVGSMSDILNCCLVFLREDARYFDLFKTVEIYVEGNYAGKMGFDGLLYLCPPHKLETGRFSVGVAYPFGDKDLCFDVTNHKYLGRRN